jgi:hypothetical protein
MTTESLKKLAKETFSATFVFRTAINIVAVALTGWGVTWFVANWTIDKAMMAQTAHIQGVETKQDADRQAAEKGNESVRQDLAAAITESSHRLEAALTHLIQCAPKARNTSGGRFHPGSCRLIW